MSKSLINNHGHTIAYKYVCQQRKVCFLCLFSDGYGVSRTQILKKWMIIPVLKIHCQTRQSYPTFQSVHFVNFFFNFVLFCPTFQFNFVQYLDCTMLYNVVARAID